MRSWTLICSVSSTLVSWYFSLMRAPLKCIMWGDASQFRFRLLVCRHGTTVLGQTLNYQGEEAEEEEGGDAAPHQQLPVQQLRKESEAPAVAAALGREHL